MSESTPGDPRYATYIDLVTYRRDGTDVHTTVWPVYMDGRLYVGTTLASGKIKRLRHNRQVRLAACNFNGRHIQGPWYTGTARQVSFNPQIRQRLESAVRAKYGWLYRLALLVSWLRGRHGRRTVLEITYAPRHKAAA